MLNFEFQLPTRFVFGSDAELQSGEMVARFGGKKVLVHYGTGSALQSGLIDRVANSLTDAGLQYELLGGAMPNPRDTLVYEGIKLIREKGIDFVLAAGGGSAIDSAKAMALGARYDGDFWDFFEGVAQPAAVVPFGVVLTVAAAGSESSNSAVITQESTKKKRGLGTEFNRPLFAIMNPSLTKTVPAYPTFCGVTDIMAHIFERYFTQIRDVDVTDRLNEALMLSVISAARVLVSDLQNDAARAEIMWAGTLAHNNLFGVGRVGDFASHQIEHELSALYDVAHGAGLAVVFPAWMRYVMPQNITRFYQFATRVWGCEMDFENPERTALRGIECFEFFLREIGMPLTLQDLGADESDIPYMARNTRRGPDGKTGFFEKLDTPEIEAILRIAT